MLSSAAGPGRRSVGAAGSARCIRMLTSTLRWLFGSLLLLLLLMVAAPHAAAPPASCASGCCSQEKPELLLRLCGALLLLLHTLMPLHKLLGWEGGARPLAGSWCSHVPQRLSSHALSAPSSTLSGLL